MRPIGSTSEADTEFDRMKQVGIMSFITYRVLLLGRFYTPSVHSQAGLVLQEILDEVVRELHKVKDEIIHGKQCL